MSHKLTTITMGLSDTTLANIDRAHALLQTATKADVIQRSVKLMNMILDAQFRGETIVVEDKHGRPIATIVLSD